MSEINVGRERLVERELMVHVERIVRPVVARQSRKLRMRRELLAHVLAAAEEERGKAGGAAHGSGVAAAGDARGDAVRGAMRRLGDPAELTRELQASVPRIERVMLARRATNWERGAPKRMCAGAPVTLGQWGILGAAFMGGGATACAFTAHLKPDGLMPLFAEQLEHPGHVTVAIILVVGLQMAWAYNGMAFLLAAATPVGAMRPRRILNIGLQVLWMQAVWMFLVITQFSRRATSASEMAMGLGLTAGLLCAGVLVGRGLEALRRPYDEWAGLEIAE